MSQPTQRDLELIEATRTACLHAALTAYEDAGVQGLCQEGRWEAAVGAIESLDLRSLSFFGSAS